MDQKFRNKYRIPSARLPSWDYGSNAAYFITICTHEMQHFLGTITDGKMHLSETGKIAYQYWNAIPDHFPFIELGEFIAMPNHIHGILIINKSSDHSDVQTPKLGVCTSPENTASPDENQIPQKIKIGRKKRTMENRHSWRHHQSIQTYLHHQNPEIQSRIFMANPVL